PETAVLMLAASGPDKDDDAVTVRVRHEPEYVLVTVAGEVDFATAGRLRERLFTLAATGRPLVADLDRVTFIDAAGLGVLAGAARQAAAHGASLRVVCARRQVRRLFSLTRLDQAVPLAASLAEVREAAGADAEAV
ncbi:MAG TPA: STAS domain-containing protein, partial [Streptosporangiaceae bacterium]|nr:STAS domain-containing protein [Streptosporangiaceae bacterium]